MHRNIWDRIPDDDNIRWGVSKSSVPLGINTDGTISYANFMTNLTYLSTGYLTY